MIKYLFLERREVPEGDCARDGALADGDDERVVPEQREPGVKERRVPCWIDDVTRQRAPIALPVFQSQPHFSAVISGGSRCIGEGDPLYVDLWAVLYV